MGSLMQLFDDHFMKAMLSSIVFWIASQIMLGIAFMLFDLLHFRSLNFSEELKNGNVALAIVVAAYLLGTALIIFGVTN